MRRAVRYSRAMKLRTASPLLALVLVTGAGVGLWLAALNVRYRDVRFIVPFLVQVWMFATPVVYPSSLLHQPWRTIYGLNPMVGRRVATAVGGRYMGADRAGEFGARNAVPGELVVRITPTHVVARADIAD